jgi:hypothetical protein
LDSKLPQHPSLVFLEQRLVPVFFQVSLSHVFNELILFQLLAWEQGLEPRSRRQALGHKVMHLGLRGMHLEHKVMHLVLANCRAD